MAKQFSEEHVERAVATFESLLRARLAGDHDAAEAAQRALATISFSVRVMPAPSKRGRLQGAGPAGCFIDDAIPRASMPNGDAITLISTKSLAVKLGFDAGRLVAEARSGSLPHFIYQNGFLFDLAVCEAIMIKRGVERGGRRLIDGPDVLKTGSPLVFEGTANSQ